MNHQPQRLFPHNWCRFIPKLEASRLSAQAIKFVIQELQERRAILEASQTEGNQYHAAIVRLVGTYGAAVDLRSIPAPVYQRHAYYGRQHTVPGTQHPRPTVHLILDALDFCAGLGVPGACCDIVSRVLPQTTGQQGDVCSLLFGLIPGVKSLLAKHGYTITSPDYSRIFQIAMVFWVGKVLGRPPAPDSGKAQLKRMELWTCKCDHCTQVLNFLRNEGERSKTWAGIGYKVKQHLEKELKNWCRGVASWEVVSSSPQGIKVLLFRVLSCRACFEDDGLFLSTGAGDEIYSYLSTDTVAKRETGRTEDPGQYQYGCWRATVRPRRHLRNDYLCPSHGWNKDVGIRCSNICNRTLHAPACSQNNAHCCRTSCRTSSHSGNKYEAFHRRSSGQAKENGVQRPRGDRPDI